LTLKNDISSQGHTSKGIRCLSSTWPNMEYNSHDDGGDVRKTVLLELGQVEQAGFLGPKYSGTARHENV